MEPVQLQLVFNVVAITGVSSLASFCYLLRKENRKLATRLQSETKQEEPDNIVAVEAAIIGGPKADTPSQHTSLAASAVTSTEKDIRTFAADQRGKWVDGMRLSATLCRRVAIEPIKG